MKCILQQSPSSMPFFEEKAKKRAPGMPCFLGFEPALAGGCPVFDFIGPR